MKSRTQLALQTNAHVLQQGQVRKHGRDLERANHTATRNLCRCFAGDVDAVEADLARSRLQKLGQQVEARGLARTVGANQRMDAAALHRKIHIAHGGKAFERFGEMGGLKNDVAHGGQAAPCWQCCRPGLLALWLACTVSNVAAHRMGELSDYALGVVPKLFNLGSYPSDKKSLQLP